MKEPWCLCTSDLQAKAREIINPYASGLPIEPTLRDSNDPHFGMGLSSMRIHRPESLARLLLISAFAVALLPLLGAAGEVLGMDRPLKANSVK